jgi:GNAT superfamily N-acetyltransferase
MIRRFDDRDAARLIDMMSRAFSVPVFEPAIVQEEVKGSYTSEGYWKKISSEYPLFVDEAEGKIIASGALDGNEIKKLYVDPDMKGRGIGSGMLAFLEGEARKNGIDEVRLTAFPFAVPFYEKHGYAAFGDIDTQMDSGTMRTVLMKKKI